MFKQSDALMKMDIDGELLGFVKARAKGKAAFSQFGTITDIITVASNTYPMTDWIHNKVCPVELAKNNTNGFKKVSNVTRPSSIALSARKDKLYVGAWQYITVFNVSGRISMEHISLLLQ